MRNGQGEFRWLMKNCTDSLSSVIERTLLLLASYPSELALVQAELDSVMSSAVLVSRVHRLLGLERLTLTSESLHATLKDW